MAELQLPKQTLFPSSVLICHFHMLNFSTSFYSKDQHLSLNKSIINTLITLYLYTIYLYTILIHLKLGPTCGGNCDPISTTCGEKGMQDSIPQTASIWVWGRGSFDLQISQDLQNYYAKFQNLKWLPRFIRFKTNLT